jgi:5-methylcytosine-specific restriction enzyme A
MATVARTRVVARTTTRFLGMVVNELGESGIDRLTINSSHFSVNMGTSKQTFNKPFSVEERASAEQAQIVFDYLFGDTKIVRDCARLLADSILLAHQMGNECWSVTLFPNRIRLNIGPVEVLVLLIEEVFLILEGSNSGDLLTGEVNSFTTAPEIYYPSVPVEQVLCNLPAEKLDDLYPAIAERHQTFIQLAARRRKKSSWRTSFSPGVIAYLNNLLGISLPIPSYFSGKVESENLFPDEIQTTKAYREGITSKVLVNVYERSAEARQTCIEHYGLNCQVCNFNFEAFYGEVGAGFIHVHHLKPISEIGKDYEINPITDLRPICPNCHAMIHRFGLISIEELKSLIKPKPHAIQKIQNNQDQL